MLIPLDSYRTFAFSDRIALTIGVFDGVHIGHQELIRHATKISFGNDGWVAAALTFDPHPAAFFASKSAPQMIDTFQDRVGLLKAHDIERVIVARFDRDFADETGDGFVQRILIETLNVGAVIVGDDFHYGRNRAGDVNSLREAGAACGFNVVSVPQVYVDGIPARSTVIRRLVGDGEVAEAAKLLGRPFSLHGEVVRGRQLGRTIGFPTANLASNSDAIVPGAGVYGGRARIGQESFRAAISVGNNPTVAPEGAILPSTVEAYLLDDFGKDIYGNEIVLEFHHRLRGMEKFSGLDAMVAQIHTDVSEVIRLLP